MQFAKDWGALIGVGLLMCLFVLGLWFGWFSSDPPAVEPDPPEAVTDKRIAMDQGVFDEVTKDTYNRGRNDGQKGVGVRYLNRNEVFERAERVIKRTRTRD